MACLYRKERARGPLLCSLCLLSPQGSGATRMSQGCSSSLRLFWLTHPASQVIDVQPGMWLVFSLRCFACRHQRSACCTHACKSACKMLACRAMAHVYGVSVFMEVLVLTGTAWLSLSGFWWTKKDCVLTSCCLVLVALGTPQSPVRMHSRPEEDD